METVFHGVDACRNGPVREKRPSAADIDCLPAEFTDAVAFHGSPHGIGHNDNLVRPLDFYQQAQDRIVMCSPSEMISVVTGSVRAAPTMPGLR